MRLIDGDGLWERLNYETWEHNADRDEIALPIVNAAPTIDAVPVVRCKDCKYAWIHPCGYVYCHRDGRNAYEMTFNLDSFCSYGERKDNG